MYLNGGLKFFCGDLERYFFKNKEESRCTSQRFGKDKKSKCVK